MQHALFLDKPIRSNPRRRAQELDVSILPSPPRETASPAPSVPLRSDPAHDSGVRSTSTIEKSTTEYLAIVASMPHPHWQTDTDLNSLVTPAFPDQAPEESSMTPGASQQPRERRKLTKAACSSCRQRKSKVRRHNPLLRPTFHLNLFCVSIRLTFPACLAACRLLFPHQQDLTLSQCDGKRPTCTTCRTKGKTCEYMTEEGVSSQTAYKTRLEDYATVLRLLQRADGPECVRILEDLRGPEGLVDGVKGVLNKWSESVECEERCNDHGRDESIH